MNCLIAHLWSEWRQDQLTLMWPSLLTHLSMSFSAACVVLLWWFSQVMTCVCPSNYLSLQPLVHTPLHFLSIVPHLTILFHPGQLSDKMKMKLTVVPAWHQKLLCYVMLYVILQNVEPTLSSQSFNTSSLYFATALFISSMSPSSLARFCSWRSFWEVEEDQL